MRGTENPETPALDKQSASGNPQREGKGMITQQTTARGNQARLEEARDTRSFVLRQIRWAEAQRNWTEAAEWQVELKTVEREIRALTAGRGW